MAFGDAIEKREGTRIWIGDYGDYIVPASLSETPMTKKGHPDKRRKEHYRKFMAWVQYEEEKAKRKING